MDAAEALIGGLGGERIRWTEQSAMFKAEIERLVGDVLILTGFLSYSGPFNQEFRQTLQKFWYDELEKRRIPLSPNLNIIECLTDTATVSTAIKIKLLIFHILWSLTQFWELITILT